MLWLLKSKAKGQMPCAMGLQQNTQKPYENHDLSWFGGDHGRVSSFFGVGRLVVDIWAHFGDFEALCVGFGVLFGGCG